MRADRPYELQSLFSGLQRRQLQHGSLGGKSPPFRSRPFGADDRVLETPVVEIAELPSPVTGLENKEFGQ
jgi:hypothetical protein